MLDAFVNAAGKYAMTKPYTHTLALTLSITSVVRMFDRSLFCWQIANAYGNKSAKKDLASFAFATSIAKLVLWLLLPHHPRLLQRLLYHHSMMPRFELSSPPAHATDSPSPGVHAS